MIFYVSTLIYLTVFHMVMQLMKLMTQEKHTLHYDATLTSKA